VLTTARLSLAEGQASDLLARLPKQPIDLCDVVDQAAERFRKRFAGIALDVAKPNQAVTCVAAETLLHRALNNLLDNAAGHGGGAPVHLTLEAKNGVSVLEVRDEGPGMRPEDAARAFEPFYRADPSRSKVGGLGLGLTLAHRVALAHGGKIALTSEVGRGTTVRVELPLG
jgi:signal transduction histidine kinase